METDFLAVHFHSPFTDTTEATAIYPVSRRCVSYLRNMDGFKHGVLLLEGCGNGFFEHMEAMEFVDASVFSDSLLKTVESCEWIEFTRAWADHRAMMGEDTRHGASIE